MWVIMGILVCEPNLAKPKGKRCASMYDLVVDLRGTPFGDSGLSLLGFYQIRIQILQSSEWVKLIGRI